MQQEFLLKEGGLKLSLGYVKKVLKYLPYDQKTMLVTVAPSFLQYEIEKMHL